MFFYLTKKIVIPNQSHLNCISWNQHHGWIAIGGNHGLLKVLKLDSSSSGGINLTSNQTLDGHSGDLKCITWNPRYCKLASSDENGLITVWTLHKNMWYEEMINNRNKSVVNDMKWSYDGQRICIIYEDGAIILGSVDGSRIWSKELDSQLRVVEWSPDSLHLLLLSQSNEITIYDVNGVLVTSFTIENPEVQIAHIVNVAWKKTSGSSIKSFTLHVTYDNGIVISWNSSNGEGQILLNAIKETFLCSWSHRGDVGALCSAARVDPMHGGFEARTANVIQFYSSSGKFIQAISLPGGNVSDIAWEQSGLRLAAAVDSHVYFIQVRPSYRFAYFANTVVYALRYGLVCIFSTYSCNSRNALATLS